MEQFMVGAAKRDITPEPGCLLCGYPVERRAQRVLDRLSVGAIALSQGDEAVVLISAELTLLNSDTCRTMRRGIAPALGLDWTQVQFFTTHTHSAPITHTMVGWGVENSGYIDRVLFPAALAAAQEAWNGRMPAVMGVGTVDSLAGINRRELTPDGTVILGQSADGPYDPTMTVLRFQSPMGQPIASLVHFATHATSAGVNHSITRDWPGYLVDRVEALSGAPCLYLNGAEGDIGPRLSNGMTTGDDSLVEEIGRIAEKDVQRAYEAAVFCTPELHLYRGQITLPYAPPPAPDELQAQITAMGDPEKLIEVDVTRYAQLCRIRQMYARGESFPDRLVLDQTVFSLGEYAMVPGPFEAFCRIACDIDARSPYRKTWFLGLANGGHGYLPTRDQLPLGGYEIDSFRAAGVTGFADDTAEQFVNANVALLEKLYHNEKKTEEQRHVQNG